ncbi:MAG: class I SAM-dependent methyltransferase [Myxococcota bacterium]
MTARQLYGDVQTPDCTAERICQWMAAKGVAPTSVIEPTCGRGAFLVAAGQAFPEATLSGLELNGAYLEEARARCPRALLRRGDAFEVDWGNLVRAAAPPRLVLGNPPWTTSGTQGVLGERNRPRGKNPTKLRGLEAVTGQSNFDVSEWLAERWFEALAPGDHLALILKRSVARRLVVRWSRKAALAIVDLDARRIFDVAVDAVLLHATPGEPKARHYTSLESAVKTEWHVEDGRIVQDRFALARARESVSGMGSWRSGVKHDCQRVFELTRERSGYRSVVEVDLDLEANWVRPLRKSTDLHHGRDAKRYLLMPPEELQRAPKIGAYLERHRALLESRKSRVYARRPFFAQFGIGPYTFAPHRVAVSGLHWPPRFRPFTEPMVFDDTCYLLPCADAAECARRLNQPEVIAGLAAIADVRGKRPITQRILNHLTC